MSASNTFYKKYKRPYPEIKNECYIQKPLGIKNLAGRQDSQLITNYFGHIPGKIEQK
jgi:hypothetical protein